MEPLNRRKFLAFTGMSAVPALLPLAPAFAAAKKITEAAATRTIKLFGDGEMLEPAEYIAELQKANARLPVVRDRYGSGGVVTELEKKFQEITGKERAIFMPTGTMANEMAIAVLSGAFSKVYVQETSHVYRDEGDAAQVVFRKRLMPLAKGKTYFTAQELQQAIESLPAEEAFKTGVGAVSVENPVRRTEGGLVPLDEIKKISAYCRNKNIPLHLDGARIFMASAWSGTSVKEYASYFDTIYISLYKYLGASAGAMLCGDAAVIDQMPYLMKVHGGTMYGNWTNAAMALHRLEGFENRLLEAKERSSQIFSALNKMPGITIAQIPGGTNIYSLRLASNIDGKRLQEGLYRNQNIRLPINDKNEGRITVNETLLYEDAGYIIDAFKKNLQRG